MFSGPDYGRPEKRLDLVKVVLCTKSDVDLDQLGKELEDAIRPEMERENKYNCEREMYFVKDVGDKLSDNIRYEIRRKGWDNANAIFIRGTVNPNALGGPKMQTKRILGEGLKKIEEKYRNKVGWSYEYAEGLDSREAMMNYNRELLKKEHLT